MGLFGGKEVFVSSVVYNMAGGEEDRIDFLKTVVASSVIGSTRFSMSECLSNSYLTGPGIKIRSFHRWARNPVNYGGIGVPTIKIIGTANYDLPTIQGQIPTESGVTNYLTSVFFGAGEYTYWADQHVLHNYPANFGTNYTADLNAVTGNITINWAGGGSVTFTPVDYDPSAQYFYVTYDRRTASALLNAKMWIYRIGSGNAVMDLQRQATTVAGEFVPFIPVRIKNNFLSETYKPTAYALARKAYKKATGGKKFSKLVEQIEDNDDLEDIDHCYMVYGTALNTKDNAARKYIFRFFDKMRIAQQYDYLTFEGYLSGTATYAASFSDYQNDRNEFLLDQPIENHGGPSDPGYTTYIPAPPPIPIQQIEIRNPGVLDTKLHMVIQWKSIRKLTGTGLGKPDAKIGELWWNNVGWIAAPGFAVNLSGALISATDQDRQLELYWQKSATEWEKLEFVGLRHKNIVHDGKAVKISAEEAIADVEESGFIVPLHYETLRELSLIDSTQMMTSAAYLVFNCYEVVKQKWYQTWAFKIFIFIVIIAISVAFPPAGGLTGLLGSAAGVGTALGFTGLMATIVGAIANAIAAMILMTVISKVSVAVFGAKLGAIIATIASAVAMSFGAPMMNGASMAQAWGNMMSAVNLLQLTSAVGNGVAKYLAASTMELQLQTQQIMEQYKSDSAAITRQWFEQFGYGNFAFDPNQLTNNNPDGLTELPQMFLDRTLMTGSDIAELSLDMISEFANMTLTPNTMGS